MLTDHRKVLGRRVGDCQADLWAACIAGASHRDLYLTDITAAGLELLLLQENPSYRFTTERARRTSHKYGAQSVSLLAIKTVPGSTNTTTTQEVSP
jgi:hypothetical protein